MKNVIVKIVDGKASTCYKHTPFNYICFVVLQKMYDYLYNYEMFCSFDNFLNKYV